MDRLEIGSGLWVDARRALWIAGEHTLVVADVHLGYAWSQRRRGALLPLAEVEEAGSRLQALVREYRPEILVFLGDLVHGPRLAAPVRAALCDLLARLAPACRLVLTVGNHDTFVPALVAEAGLPLQCVCEWRAGPHLLLHGDQPGTVLGGRGFVVMGHEHPVLVLGDDVATHARCPCFLEGTRRLMLPAFSRWAAGVVAGRSPFMSKLAATAHWHAAVVVLGDRLLRLP